MYKALIIIYNTGVIHPFSRALILKCVGGVCLIPAVDGEEAGFTLDMSAVYHRHTENLISYRAFIGLIDGRLLYRTSWVDREKLGQSVACWSSHMGMSRIIIAE